MQGRLAVEQDDVTIVQVPLDNVPDLLAEKGGTFEGSPRHGDFPAGGRTLSSAAILRLSPYLRNHLFSLSWKMTKLAPGCVLMPLMTRCRSRSMFCSVTRSG